MCRLLSLEYVNPYSHTHTCVILFHVLQWGKSETKGGAERAVKLFRAMPDYNIAPGRLHQYLLI